jgi:hypothetical protein
MPDPQALAVLIPAEARPAERLFAAIAALQADAHAHGRTDEIVDEALAAHDADRRDRRSPPE